MYLVRSLGSRGCISVVSGGNGGGDIGRWTRMTIKNIHHMTAMPHARTSNATFLKHNIKPEAFYCRGMQAAGFSSKSSDKNTGASEPPPVGYDLALERAAHIVINVTEKAMTLLLHAYCGSRFVQYLEDHSNFDVVGCSDKKSDVIAAKAMKQYSEANRVNFSKQLPYRGGSFQCVVALYPPRGVSFTTPIPGTTSASVSAGAHVAAVNGTSAAGGDTAVTGAKVGLHMGMMPVEEAVRVVNDNGFALFGASEEVWVQEKIFEQLEDLDKKKQITLLSLQTVPLPAAEADTTDGKESCYYIALARVL